MNIVFGLVPAVELVVLVFALKLGETCALGRAERQQNVVYVAVSAFFRGIGSVKYELRIGET